MEYLAIGIFCTLLLICIVCNVSILFAMLAGLLIFFLCGMRKGYSLREVFHFALAGVKTARNILITFVLIGMMTALWRWAGTIPVIVCFLAEIIHPSVFLLMVFLMNSLLSFLTGTSFGTAATMGVVCSAMGASLGIPPALLGGAVLSGIYFGDRCSPVSTSALLIADLTGTDIFSNIRRMLRSALVPFLLTCALYGAAGALLRYGGEVPDLSALFAREFVLSPYAALPAAVLLVLSLCKVNVKLSMAASILAAVPVGLLLQGAEPGELPGLLLKGFTPAAGEVAAMLSGGGIASMLKVGGIVCISSAYAGIFQNTGLLADICAVIKRLADRTTAFAAILLTAILTGILSCNQTLTILLTDQLAASAMPEAERRALALENSAAIIPALIPWSIACAVPLATIGAPAKAIAFACFLYLLPAWELLRSAFQKLRQRGEKNFSTR